MQLRSTFFLPSRSRGSSLALLFLGTSLAGCPSEYPRTEVQNSDPDCPDGYFASVDSPVDIRRTSSTGQPLVRLCPWPVVAYFETDDLTCAANGRACIPREDCAFRFPLTPVGEESLLIVQFRNPSILDAAIFGATVADTSCQGIQIEQVSDIISTDAEADRLGSHASVLLSFSPEEEGVCHARVEIEVEDCADGVLTIEVEAQAFGLDAGQ